MSIEFRLLGNAGLTGPEGREIRSIVTRSHRLALLAYLAAATPRGLHRRDKLLALFWPDLDQEHARAALRQAVYVLREALGASVLVSRGEEQIGIEFEHLWCDVAAFDRAVGVGQLTEALELYRGDLLEGFFISGAPEFERWLESERARLRETAGGSARVLLQRAESSGDFSTAALWARRAVRLAPDDEEVVRALISLLDRLGDRAGALKAYDVFAARLAKEYEAQPAPESQSLIAAVRAREASRALIAESPAPPTPIVPTHSTKVTVAPHRWARVRRPAVLVPAVLAATGLLLAAVLPRPRGSDDAGLKATRVVVAPLANRTGDGRWDPVGDLAADWITRELAQTGLLEVGDLGLLLGRQGPRPVLAAGTGGEAESARALALATGAGIAVWGSFHRRGDSIEFAVQITDERRGQVVRSLEPVTGDAADPRPAIALLRQRVTASLATLLDARLSEWAGTASQPPSYEAYRAFVEGMDAMNRLEPRAALPHLLRSAAMDSTFTLPLAWVAWVYRFTGWGECNRTDSLARELGTRRERLARLDQSFLEREQALCRGDVPAAYRVAHGLVEALPGSEAMAELLGREALIMERPREAIEVLGRLHPDRGALVGRLNYYYLWLTSAYHALGEHREELEAAQRARRALPQRLGPVRLELRALAALGRVREVDQLLNQVAALPPAPLRIPSAAMWETALELRAHGYTEAGRDVLRRTLSWLRSQSPAAQRSEDGRLELTLTLWAADMATEARPVAERLAREHPDNPLYLGLSGVLAAQRGDRAAAERADHALADSSSPFHPGLRTYWRAAIAARLSEVDAASDLLVRAVAQGYSTMIRYQGEQWNRHFDIGLHADPNFESLHGYPQYQALLRPKE